MEGAEQAELIRDLERRDRQGEPDDRSWLTRQQDDERRHQIELPFQRQAPGGSVEGVLRERQHENR